MTPEIDIGVWCKKKARRKLTPYEIKLLLRFLEQLSDHMGNAGSNDLDMVMIAECGVNLEQLLRDYNEWDAKANPDGWEPKAQVANIPDFCLLGYLISKVEELGA